MITFAYKECPIMEKGGRGPGFVAGRAHAVIFFCLLFPGDWNDPTNTFVYPEDAVLRVDRNTG